MAAELRKSRKSNFSQEEVDVLVTTVIQNHDILYGESSKSYFHKEIRNQVWNIVLEEVNKVSQERRTINEVKNKWKKYQFHLKALEESECWDKDAIADDLGNREARKRFGISEETVKRWRKLRTQIMEMAQQCIRRSQRHHTGSESGPPPVKEDMEKIYEEDLDSMPLQQRLSQNLQELTSSAQSQDTILQSQPISPTKLKVTRQGKPQQPPHRLPSPPPPNPTRVCLKWNSHHVNMQSVFPNLLTKEQYVDATLVSEGKTLKCHKMILSSCSPYFEEVLKGIGPLQHPVLFMKDVPFWILKALCDFMYAGEVHIMQNKLEELLSVAKYLKIKGLAGSPDANEGAKPDLPEIKQELNPSDAPKGIERLVKLEREDPPLLGSLRSTTRHEVAKLSKKREDRKTRHASQVSIEEPPSHPLKAAFKVALSREPVVQKSQVAKNAIKPVSKFSSPRTYTSRKGDTSRRYEKLKAELAVQERKVKEQEKPPLTKENINDPLDLLQPVYEEIAKEPPLGVQSATLGKLRERGNVPFKKGVNRKVKKRRYAEFSEEREESPPPVFHLRKGTRSRPHVKIPKFFHTLYDDITKDTTDAPIVREPHTDQNDPLIGADDIKTEPVDVEENIEVGESGVNYMGQDQEEEIIGNYDSPLVNIERESKTQPVIVSVHSVSEPDMRLLNIAEEKVQIVDIAKISTNSFDIIASSSEKPSDIIISDVQSVADFTKEQSQHSKTSMEYQKGPSEPESITSRVFKGIGVKSLADLQPQVDGLEILKLPQDDDPLKAQISESQEELEEKAMETDVQDDIENHELVSVHLSNLEAKMESSAIQSMQSMQEEHPQQSPALKDDAMLECSTEPTVISEDLHTTAVEEYSGSTEGCHLDPDCLEPAENLIQNEAERDECVRMNCEDRLKSDESKSTTSNGEGMPKNGSSSNDPILDTREDLVYNNSASPSDLPRSPTLPKEKDKVEDSLLEDLDEDVLMKNTTTDQDDTAGSEKTLEMIVNDLNESLGEMRN